MKTIVPVGTAQVGCTVTLPTGVVKTHGVSVSELSVASGSDSFPDIVAVFAYEPVAFNVATTVNVALDPFAKLPIVQFGALHVPTLGVTEVTVYPEGMLSTTDTPVAELGPELLAVIVKVTVLPTFGVALSTTFVKDKSAEELTTGITLVTLSQLVGLPTSHIWYSIL